MNARKSSLRVQLILLTVIALLVLGAALEVTRVFQQRNALINAERRIGLTLVRSVNTTINSVRSFINTLSDISELNTRLTELVTQNDNIRFIAVAATDGTIIFHSDNTYEGRQMAELAGLPADSTTERAIEGFGTVLLTSQTFDSSDLNEPDSFSIIVASATEPINALLINVVLSSIVVTLLITVVTAVVIIWFVRTFFIVPLEQLTETAQAISAGNLSRRVAVKSENEIGQLSQTFNSMTEQLVQSVLEFKKARDEALAAKRIADENSRLKSEFLSMMSHELRTPMNAIEGFTSIMLNRMAGVEYNEKAERYMQKIQSNSQRLLSLINDFLDLSRIESGRFQLAHLPMSPREMAQKWRDNLSVLADEKGLVFEVQVDPSLPDKMIGDEEAISKIVINLVGNAIKFTEAGRVGLSLEKRADEMAVVVEDTGSGIPPHARDFIFEEFRQVDQSSKRQHGGTGLGLAIVQKLTREMGGIVTLQSEVGVGSTFTVLLPIQVETEKQLV
jgi:signal transduction histidine kinase